MKKKFKADDESKDNTSETDAEGANETTVTEINEKDVNILKIDCSINYIF